MLCILVIAALLATGKEVGFSKTLGMAGVLGICPGIHATFLVSSDSLTCMSTLLVSSNCVLKQVQCSQISR